MRRTVGEIVDRSPRNCVGDAYDNALAESFVDSFKTELIADRVWRSRTQLELAVVEYIGWYNGARLHASLGDIRRSSTSNCTSAEKRVRSSERSREPPNPVPVKPGPAQDVP